MTKKAELIRTSELVKQFLENEPATRDSDNLLYHEICKYCANKLGINILKAPFGDVILRMKDYGIPPFETVRRTRQKVQHDNPHLAGSDEVERRKAVNEKIYNAYARSVI